MREKIISLELSNAEEDVDNGKLGTGASDAESESEDPTGQDSISTTVESSESFICTTPTSENAPNMEKTGTNGGNAKKKKRKRSKRGRN